MLRIGIVALLLIIATSLTPARAETIISGRLSLHDPDTGLPIDSVNVGEEFDLRVYVSDVRNPPPQVRGVFAAYVAVAFPAANVTPLTLDVMPDFDLLPESNISAAEIMGGGARLTLDFPELPPEGQWLFSARLLATSIGSVDFLPSVVIGPDLEWLVYTSENSVRPEEVQLSGAQLNIVPEPASLVMAVFAAALVVPAGRRRLARRGGLVATRG